MSFQWDDVRIFLAVIREASITAAAEALGMHQSTVSRRLMALEESLGCPLVRRGNHGVSLTTPGRRMWELGQNMGKAAQDLEDHFRILRDAPRGVVRVTTVEEIAVQFIVPGLTDFRRRWPEVEIELVTMPRIMDLSRGEADVSIRLLRPQKGDLHATKLAEFGYGLFATQAYVNQLPNAWQTEIESLDWIFMEESDFKLPEWEHFKSQMPHIKPVLRCNSFKTLVSTVQAGLGVAILPKGVPYFYPELKRFPVSLKIPKREIWLCVADDRRESAAVQAVCEFLIQVIVQPLKKLHAKLYATDES